MENGMARDMAYAINLGHKKALSKLPPLISATIGRFLRELRGDN
jgi:hypothetical protein